MPFPELFDALSRMPPALASLVTLTEAALAGCLVAKIYRSSVGRDAKEALSFVTTLTLLTILVAMTTMVIADSLARAFGLVGALAIVRFRTVVSDTRDTAFVIFAVAMGMAIGAGKHGAALAALPVVAAVVILPLVLRDRRGGGSRSLAAPRPTFRRLLVRIPAGGDGEKRVQELLVGNVKAFELAGVMTSRQGTALDLEYGIELGDGQDAIALVRSVNALEGVQHVELGQR